MPRSDMRRWLTGSFNPVLSTIRCSSPAPLLRTVQYVFGVNVIERAITSFTGVCPSRLRTPNLEHVPKKLLAFFDQDVLNRPRRDGITASFHRSITPYELNRFISVAGIRVRARKCGMCGYDKLAGLARD